MGRADTLTPVRIEHALAAEVLLLSYPVLLGKGKRFFSDTAAARELSLITSKPGPSGIVINTYKPKGPLRTGTVS
jgi:dihydrofolate reductase